LSNQFIFVRKAGGEFLNILIMYPDRLISEPSKKTPWVILEPGEIFIMGRSISENPGDFYRPILDWLSKYINNYVGSTKIELGFEYVNTSSTKWIYTVLKELSEMKGIVSDARFSWYYEKGDEDMFELGSILKSLVESPFEVFEVPEMNRALYETIRTGKFKASL
jgi:hypothetical protein